MINKDFEDFKDLENYLKHEEEFKNFLLTWFSLENKTENDVFQNRSLNLLTILLNSLFLKNNLKKFKIYNLDDSFELNKRTLIDYLNFEKIIKLKEEFEEILNKKIIKETYLLEKLHKCYKELKVYLDSMPAFNYEKYKQNKEIENTTLEAHGFVSMSATKFLKS